MEGEGNREDWQLEENRNRRLGDESWNGRDREEERKLRRRQAREKRQRK